MRPLNLLACCAVIATVSSIALRSQSPNPANAVLFEGARLIVGDGSAPIESGTFVVQAGHITAVGRKGTVSAPAGAVRVDLTGKTVIPAMVNVHVHIRYEGYSSWGAQNHSIWTRASWSRTTARSPSASGQNLSFEVSGPSIVRRQLLFPFGSSNCRRSLYISDLTEVEVISALSRKIRIGELAPEDASAIRNHFVAHLEQGIYRRTALGPHHIRSARELLSGFTTPLRTLDALHLAITASENLHLVTADETFTRAAKALSIKATYIKAR